MKKPTLALLPAAIAALLAVGVHAQSATGAAALSSRDKAFLTKAAQSDVDEIAAAKVAVQKSANPDVKRFAQQMIDDHTKSSEELKKLASAKGVPLPVEPDSKHRRAMEGLQKKEGEDFDKAYMKQAGRKDHHEAVELFQKAAKNAKDADVKQFAQSTLPTIEQHEKMVLDMTDRSGSVANKAGGRSSSRGMSDPGDAGSAPRSGTAPQGSSRSGRSATPPQ